MTSSYRINYQLRSHKRDALIEFIKGTMQTSFVLYDEAEIELPHSSQDRGTLMRSKERYAEIMSGVEKLINDHIELQKLGTPEHSRLHRLVPTVSQFFTPLPLRKAFLLADAQQTISARHFVPPSFNDIRRILNTAQVCAIAPTLKLITFDGDMTLYDDGKDFQHDSALVALIIKLLSFNLNVAVVTAAGYTENAEARYEGRLSGLLEGFRLSNLTNAQLARFHVLGGECNFLFQLGEDYHLHFVPEETYQPETVRTWSQNAEEINAILDIAQVNIQKCVDDMGLSAVVIRKAKAVGLVPQPGVTILREILDEVVLSTQHHLLRYQRSPSVLQAALPFCCFNGGSDVWLDIGNKLIGVQMLQAYLNAKPEETLHVGDQFLSTGNDYATRSSCCTLWIINPQETQEALVQLTDILEKQK
ncbi:IMP 5'-nucleotidase [Umbelopsis sp. WA50703]